jgi:hypothetical protein
VKVAHFFPCSLVFGSCCFCFVCVISFVINCGGYWLFLAILRIFFH